MRYDSIIVGGGIIGLSIGWRASQLGLSVLILEKGDPPDAASAAAAGMLAPVTETTFGEDALLQLNLESARRWKGFAEELSFAGGINLADHRRGILHIALDRDQSESLSRLFEYQQELGLQVQWLSSMACRRLEPALHPSTRAGILAQDDWAVDPRSVLDALRTVLRSAGATLRHGAVVTKVKSGPSPSVHLDTGETIEAGSVVIAAGPWSGQIPGIPSRISRAVRPVKGQILRLRPAAPLPPPITQILRTEEVYLVPRPGGEIVAGATVEEKGFDTAATAGGVFELLRAAGELVPGIREMELVEVKAGLRPGTPDNAPLLGAVEPGLVMATGHFRNGVLLAPVTADGIAELLAKGDLPAELAGFDPRRFQE